MLFAPSRTFDSSDCKLMPQGDGKRTEEHLSDAAYVWVDRDSKRVNRIYYTLEYTIFGMPIRFQTVIDSATLAM